MIYVWNSAKGLTDPNQLFPVMFLWWRIQVETNKESKKVVVKDERKTNSSIYGSLSLINWVERLTRKHSKFENIHASRWSQQDQTFLLFKTRFRKIECVQNWNRNLMCAITWRRFTFTWYVIFCDCDYHGKDRWSISVAFNISFVSYLFQKVMTDYAALCRRFHSEKVISAVS